MKIFSFLSHFFFSGIVRNDTFFDRIVFKKIREQMGGRVRVLTIGSAPTAHAVLSFARAALGCIVVEGYGMKFTDFKSREKMDRKQPLWKRYFL